MDIAVNIFAVVALADVLEEMGMESEAIDKATEKICEYIESETDEVPEQHESFTSFITDDELLQDALKKAKVDVDKFTAITDKISSANNDVPVVISF